MDDDQAAIDLSTEGGVYHRIRNDILRARLLPGEKLKVDRLRERYGTSGSPLREALSRLAAEGLVKQEEQRGFRVAAVSLEELEELARTRKWVDQIALRESLINGGRDWEEAVVLAHYRLSRAPQQLTPEGTRHPRWIECHREFHAALLAGCPSKPLLNFCRTLFDSAARYRELAVHAEAEQRDVGEEHRQMMNAVLDRDYELAQHLQNEHIEKTAASIVGITRERT